MLFPTMALGFALCYDIHASLGYEHACCSKDIRADKDGIGFWFLVDPSCTDTQGSDSMHVI